MAPMLPIFILKSVIGRDPHRVELVRCASVAEPAGHGGNTVLFGPGQGYAGRRGDIEFRPAVP